MHGTRGGITAHLLRRCIHLSIILFPLFYYFYLAPIFSFLQLRLFLCVFIGVIVLFESLRIKKRVVFFGQRHHEATHFSAFGWTMISLAIIFLVMPTPVFALPIIVSCALADPLMGEMRLRQKNKLLTAFLGVFVIAVVWFCFAKYFHFSCWYLLLAPLTVAVEWPSFRWIDDNALMLLVPLVVVMFK